MKSLVFLASILFLFLNSSFLLVQSHDHEDSIVKFRLYKDFLKDIFEKNIKMIFAKNEELQLKDIILDNTSNDKDKNSGIKLSNIRMNI